MARKSKELIDILELFNEDEFLDEEELELMNIDAKFIYKLNENASYIVDERNLGYVLHSVESIILSVIFAIITNCNNFVQIHLFIQKHFEWLDKHIKSMDSKTTNSSDGVYSKDEKLLRLMQLVCIL